MDTHLLEVFGTVARLGSITAAARTLQFTQSAVSRQIAALEDEIGAQVFDRQPRGVTLTEQGRVLLPHAEAMLERLATARRDLDDLHGLASGRLRVGAFPTAVASLVPQALALFRSANPGVTLSLVEGLTPALLDRLMSGDADVAVVSSAPTVTIDQHFDLHPLIDERLLVAVARTHPLARRRIVRLAELADDAFIVGSATAEDALLRASLRADFRPRIDIVAADWTGKFGCVSAGLGVALVPALATRGVPADIALLRLHPDDESIRRVFAATVTGRLRPPAVTDFLAHLAQVAQQFQGPRPSPAARPSRGEPLPSWWPRSARGPAPG